MATPSRALGALLSGLAALVISVSAVFAASGTLAGTGTGVISSEGTLDPLGDGRFRVSGREYSVRLVSDDAAACFRGNVRISEEAVLSVPHYAGSHNGSMNVTSDSGSLLIAYRGSMDRYTGRGDWWVVRGSGACADVTGLGN